MYHRTSPHVKAALPSIGDLCEYVGDLPIDDNDLVHGKEGPRCLVVELGADYVYVRWHTIAGDDKTLGKFTHLEAARDLRVIRAAKRRSRASAPSARGLR
jgi:hypothetical protein